MSPQKLRIWVTTLIEYDGLGNAAVIKQFTSIAKDSEIKGQRRLKSVKREAPISDNEELF